MTEIRTLLAVFALAGMLGGCGFQPLYGSLGEDEDVSQKLSAIQIGPAATTRELALKNFLLDRLTPGGPAAKNDFQLQYRLREGNIGGAVRIDRSVTRYNYRLTAIYKLLRKDTGKIIHDGKSQSIVAYDVVDSQFATVISRENAQKRAAREVANDIVLRLSLFMDSYDPNAQIEDAPSQEEDELLIEDDGFDTLDSVSPPTIVKDGIEG